jgi:hypothetical protein
MRNFLSYGVMPPHYNGGQPLRSRRRRRIEMGTTGLAVGLHFKETKNKKIKDSKIEIIFRPMGGREDG